VGKVDLMQGAQKKVLEEFITNAADLAISILLVGSHALDIAHEDSDIDLIVIAKQERDVEIIQEIGKKLNTSVSRPDIDCKVYTESEFSSIRTGRENRFLWTCVSNGKVLFGEDITETIQLVPQRVSESYWTHVQSVEDACRNLDAGVQYTGSCHSLYDALSTSYFVDRFIFQSIKDGMNKEEFIKSHLRNEFSRVRERYYWIVGRIETANSQDRLRIPVGVDRKFKESDYRRMHLRALDVLDVVQDQYKKIMHWSE
jgi:hypothetical protein